MTLAVAHPQPPRAWLALQSPALELANAIAGTDFVPKHLRGNPAAICAAILYGDEVGLGPMQSLAHIAVINGRPTLSAEAQRALILAAGHDLWVEESTVTRCVVCGRRRDSDATSRVTWTMDDAKRAGLAGQPAYRRYPRAMLLARASAELARAVFPDATGGLAATEELDGDPDTDTDTSPAPAAASTRRRRANVSTPTSTPTPGGGSTPEPPPVPGDDPPSDPITDRQRKKLHALFRDRGYDDRQERLAYCSAFLGRPIKTSTELTADEASALIDHFEGRTGAGTSGGE